VSAPSVSDRGWAALVAGRHAGWRAATITSVIRMQKMRGVQRLMRREANCPPMLALACGYAHAIQVDSPGPLFSSLVHARGALTRPPLHRRGFVV